MHLTWRAHVSGGGAPQLILDALDGAIAEAAMAEKSAEGGGAPLEMMARHVAPDVPPA